MVTVQAMGTYYPMAWELRKSWIHQILADALKSLPYEDGCPHMPPEGAYHVMGSCVIYERAEHVSLHIGADVVGRKWSSLSGGDTLEDCATVEPPSDYVNIGGEVDLKRRESRNCWWLRGVLFGILLGMDIPHCKALLFVPTVAPKMWPRFL